jgi:HK97 family phage portal protein
MMGIATLVSRGLFSRAQQIEGNARAPADWLFDTFGGGPTDTGERVSRDRSLTVAAWWRGMNLLSFDVAKVPFHVMKRQEDGGKEKATNHPAYSLLKSRFNEYLTAFQGKLLLTFHRMMHGNGYAFINRDGTASPIELIQLDPELTWPVKANGRLYYMLEIPMETDIDGNVTASDLRRVEATDVLHIKGLGYDGLVGYDVLTYARESLAMDLASRKYGAKFFAKGGQPAIILETPAGIPKNVADNLKTNWNKIRKGIEDAHRVALLTHGITAKVLSPTAQQSQFVELRKFNVRDIANFIGVPPHMLGDDAKSSFASIEMEDQRYLDGSLDPILATWEDECNSKLLTERQFRNDTHVCEFKREAVVSLDYKTKTEGITNLTNNGLISDNEGRNILNLPSRGPEGDRFRIPANIEYVDDREKKMEMEAKKAEQPQLPAPGQVQPPEPQEDEPDEDSEQKQAGARACLEIASRHVVKMLGGIVTKAAKVPGRYVEACEGLDKELAAVAQVLSPAIMGLRGLSADESEAASLVASRWLVEAATEAFLAASECGADELAGSVRGVVEVQMAELPGKLREFVETGAS